MSAESERRSTVSFTKAFVPGLIVGLIIGAFAGAFITPLLDSGMRTPIVNNPPVAKPSRGDSRLAPAEPDGDPDIVSEGQPLEPSPAPPSPPPGGGGEPAGTPSGGP
jgi:hypothetical protein